MKVLPEGSTRRIADLIGAMAATGYVVSVTEAPVRFLSLTCVILLAFSAITSINRRSSLPAYLIWTGSKRSMKSKVFPHSCEPGLKASDVEPSLCLPVESLICASKVYRYGMVLMEGSII